jgi:hypothetical protein
MLLSLAKTCKPPKLPNNFCMLANAAKPIVSFEFSKTWTSSVLLTNAAKLIVSF